jgi:hypothetical protein
VGDHVPVSLGPDLRRRAASWGTRPAEETVALPCDALLPGAGVVLHRAVGVAAPAPLVFRWLCQLRAAPYSYDLLDNAGRRSPQELTPGLDELEVGQRVMTIFRLEGFEPDRSLTLLHRGRLFGRVAVTYTVGGAGTGVGASRLVARIRWEPPALSVGREALATALAFGDLVMARRQLLNLKRLAERDVGRGRTVPPACDGAAP